MSWQDWLLDGLFPPTCIGCEKDGVWLCDDCFLTIDIRTQASCPQCGHYPWSSHLCNGDWPFASFISIGSYADPTLQKLLRSYKYKRARCVEPIFTQLLQKFARTFKEVRPWSGDNHHITSLPMDPTRLRERGLDHAAFLAEVFQKELMPNAVQRPLLFRTKQVVPNASLKDPVLRAANMQGVFQLTEPVTTPVVLVDDVCTTGATAREAAKVLLEAGVPEVHLFTFASGVRRQE